MKSRERFLSKGNVNKEREITGGEKKISQSLELCSLYNTQLGHDSALVITSSYAGFEQSELKI
jgi:hypothetical protein